jgi:hypothetical protein
LAFSVSVANIHCDCNALVHVLWKIAKININQFV